MTTRAIETLIIKLLELMKRYPDYFITLLCRYYPFTREMLKKYQSCLNWSNLSWNGFLEWNEELLMSFKDKSCWNSIIYSIIGIKGLENPDMLIMKFYEMGLIEVNDIIEGIYYMNAICDSECDHAYLHSVEYHYDRKEERKERLGAELKKAIKLMIKREEERLLLLEESQKPAEELEQIISFLEKKSEILEPSIPHLNKDWFEYSLLTDPFVCDNSLGNGFDYTFNTPEKRNILDVAVKTFLDLHSFDKLKEKMSRLKKEDKQPYCQYMNMQYEDYIKSFWNSLDANGNPPFEKEADRQLYYKHMGGQGTISCYDCGYKSEIVSFLHGVNNAVSGYQCQGCGSFQSLKTIKPLTCSCGGELSRDKPIFCPQCKSKNMEYWCSILT